MIAAGQVYKHHSGRLYVISDIANLSHPSDKFPVMAIYVGEDNSKWARPAVDFVAPRFVLTNDVEEP